MEINVSSKLPEFKPEIELLYDTVSWLSPSRVTSTDSNQNLRQRFAKTLQAQSHSCRTNLTDIGARDFGIFYGSPGQQGEGTEAFDWYAPVKVQGDLCHLVIYVHGGFWRSLDLPECSHWVWPVTKVGAVFVALGYRLVPFQSIQSMPERICKGLMRAYRHTLGRIEQLAAGTMKLSVHLIGHSAGAHLAVEALMYAKEHPEDNVELLSSMCSIILISGLYDLRPLIHTSSNTSLGFTSSEEAWRCSPFRHFDDPTLFRELKTRWLIVWAEHDPPGFIQQSEEMLQRLKRIYSCSLVHNSCTQVQSFVVKQEDHFSSVECLYHGVERSDLVKRILLFIGVL